MSLRIIGGLFRGRILKSPKTLTTRPTTSMVREAIFNICQDLILDARFCDLYAGSGAMGFEALSRGAQFVTFIEKDKIASTCIRENTQLLQVEEKVQILSMDVKKALSQLTAPYDIIYIDPPYDTSTIESLETISKKRLLTPNGLLFLEERHEKKSQSFEIENLSLIESRRYGIASIHLFQMKNS